MLRHWKPLVTEFALAEALDRSVDEQDHHLVLQRRFLWQGDFSRMI